MKNQINMITIWTEEIEAMKIFYRDIMKFEVIEELSGYIEFENEGVRFAICKREVMQEYEKNYRKTPKGQRFELAFACETVEELEEDYIRFKEKEIQIIKEPFDAPWNHRVLLFSDPDGNIHELFCRL